jgi:hypothetical protein
MASIMSALIFFLIANPETFIVVRRIFGNWVASATGYPTTLGLVLHSVVFMLIVWGLMNIKKEKAEGDMNPPPPPVPEGPAEKDGMLPPEAAPDQPMSDTMMGVPSPAPIISVLPPPSPSPMITDGTMSKMSNMLGGYDISGGAAVAAPAVYGTNWRQCSCGDGTQVMVLK